MSAPIAISDWQPRENGTLRGFFTAALPSGLVLHELMLHERGGKVRYGAPLIEFASRADRDRFMAQALAALRATHPKEGGG
jgi:hypothetical protein